MLATLHPQVRWARAREGYYAAGHAEVRAYWLRQWQKLAPHVEPTRITVRADGRLKVAGHQVAHDKQGQLLLDGPVKHLYTVQNGPLLQMDIEAGRHCARLASRHAGPRQPALGPGQAQTPAPAGGRKARGLPVVAVAHGRGLALGNAAPKGVLQQLSPWSGTERQPRPRGA